MTMDNNIDPVTANRIDQVNTKNMAGQSEGDDHDTRGWFDSSVMF